MSTVEQAILQKVQALPLEQQQEVLKFVEALPPAVAPPAAELQAEPPRMKIWEEIDEISQEVPLAAWAELPTDGSLNLDHYLYGAPKRV
jgi:hypothetical protein